VLTGKRSSIITVINAIEAARSEDVWLADYEADEQRYKVKLAPTGMWGGDPGQSEINPALLCKSLAQAGRPPRR
jgi:hypothetical protein